MLCIAGTTVLFYLIYFCKCSPCSFEAARFKFIHKLEFTIFNLSISN